MPPESRVHATLTIAAFAVAQALCWGMTFNLPAITGSAMAAALALPYPVIMAGPTAMLVVMAIAAMPALGLFERHGARRVMMAGTMIAAAGLLVISTSTAAPAYFAGWAILGVAGAGVLTTAMQIGVAELAGERARAMIGLLMVLGGLGSTISWPLLGALQASFGWRLATGIGAAILLVIPLPIYWWLLARRPRVHAVPEGTRAGAPLDWPLFILLAFSTATNGVVTWGFSLTIITLFEGRGLPHATAISIASVIGLVAVAARLIDHLGGSRWGSLATGLAAGTSLPLSFAVLIFGTGTPAAVAFVILYGLSSGTLAIARATLPLALFPPSAYARASSMLALPLNLAFASAPPVFAAILAGPGSDAALWVATALSLLALVALLALARRARRLALPSDVTISSEPSA